MMIHIIEGEDKINEALMGAMTTTIGTLVKERVITEGQGNDFLDTHLCMYITHDGGLRSWVKRLWPTTSISKIVVVNAGADGRET